MEFPVLSLMTFLPLVGVLFIMFARGDDETVAHNVTATALITSVFTFGLSLYMYAGFNPAADGYQFVEKYDWLPALKISYRMGVDGVSVFFILLSTFLTPLCILASRAIRSRVKEYMMAFLLLETMMLGMFSSLDLILFYVFFEGVLIPMFLIIGVWGGQRRVYAAFKFFLYTLLGSVLFLIAILAIYRFAGTTDIEQLTAQVKLPGELQKWAWLAFFASFAVKVPMWPVHTWLPDAHVEAPTAGSVILAGVLLKMGGYGFLRLSLPILPEASHHFTPLIFSLSAVAVIYTSLVALVQEDMKKLIAYSSVAHMGFVTIGIFSANIQSVDGAMLQMLSHGIVSSALFLCVGVVYDRLHTREIARYGGLVKVMPVYAAFFMLFTMASVGLPGTGGFVGEFLVLAGAFKSSTLVAALASSGVVLGAAYMLHLYRRVVFGPLTKPDLKSLKDLDAREFLIFVPLAALVVWMGVYPTSFIAPMEPALNKILIRYHERAEGLQKADAEQPPAIGATAVVAPEPEESAPATPQNKPKAKKRSKAK
jgi:NADH-quinone oxidoreductase subunit M